jgi:ubiquinone/menaquinone biosynthesis C-methylase UbiE
MRPTESRSATEAPRRIHADGPAQLADWLEAQKAHLPTNGRALDAACGAHAVAAAFFVKQNLETFACDALETTLAEAKTHAPKATFLASPLAELDFPEDYFDVIAVGAALLSQPRSTLLPTLRNLRRMLRPGGALIGAADGDQLERLAPSIGLLLEELVPCGAVIKDEALFRATKI